MNETDPDINNYFHAINNDIVYKRQIIKYEKYIGNNQIDNINIDNWINSIDMKLWKNVDSWEYKYNVLIQWVKNNNNKIPSNQAINDIEKCLGQFAAKQREYKKTGKLDAIKIKKLELIDNWFWDLDELWNIKYNELVLWITNNNNKIPSNGATDETEKRLGSFASTQRACKKAGNIDDVKIKKLELINNWFWSDDNVKVKKTWNESYNELVLWIKNNKNKLPKMNPENEIENYFGVFSCNQRIKKRNNKLSDDKIKKLEEIDCWYWEKDEFWNENYNELVKWVTNNNNIMPLTNSTNDIEKNLGSFAGTQRSDKKLGKLSDDKIERLEMIPNWFWSIEEIWEKSYNELVIWCKNNKTKKNNKLPSAKSLNEQEKRLGFFVKNLRQSKKLGQLTDDKIKKLELIIGWYWDKKDSWDETYDELTIWMGNNKNKIPNFKSIDETEKRLGGFARNQQYSNRTNTLDEEKFKKMESIKGWFWDKQDLWNKTYRELLLWRTNNNNKIPDVNSNDDVEKKLGLFVRSQLKNKKLQIINNDRIIKTINK